MENMAKTLAKLHKSTTEGATNNAAHGRPPSTAASATLASPEAPPPPEPPPTSFTFLVTPSPPWKQVHKGALLSVCVNNYELEWGCPHTLLSLAVSRGAKFTAKVAREAYRMLGAKKRYTSAYHPEPNSSVERLHHIMAQMLSHVVSASQDDWDDLLTHVVSAHNNNVSQSSGLAPNEIYMGRIPRLPMTVLGGRDARGNHPCRVSSVTNWRPYS